MRRMTMNEQSTNNGLQFAVARNVRCTDTKGRSLLISDFRSEAKVSGSSLAASYVQS